MLQSKDTIYLVAAVGDLTVKEAGKKLDAHSGLETESRWDHSVRSFSRILHIADTTTLRVLSRQTVVDYNCGQLYLLKKWNYSW